MTTYHFTIETTDYLNFGPKSVSVHYDNDKYIVIEKTGSSQKTSHKLIFSCNSYLEPDKKNQILKNALTVLYNNYAKIESIEEFINSTQDDVPLFIYPYTITDSKDLEKETDLLSISKIDENYYLKTHGLMGYISATFKEDDSKPDSDDYHFNIYIHSRFDYTFKQSEDASGDENTPNFNHDYFLHYMLQRVLNINLFECDPDTSDNQIELGLLLYFFPGLLRRAMKQGLYKQYVHREYNDDKVRGPIDVSRHIRYNIPFCGKIAYSATEYDYDNPITQLVRHTIEYIRHHDWASGLLRQSDETWQDVQMIVNNTERYNANERCRIVQLNLRRLNHPFYTEWRPLQHLCLSILRHEDIRYDSVEDEDRIHGILFDGPWLWERYLDWLLNTKNSLGFIHPDNKTGENAICLFRKDSKSSDEEADIEGDGRTRKYPDFYKKIIRKESAQLASEIWDAKFKPYDKKSAINRDDVHQLITYLYIQSLYDKNNNDISICKTAGVVFPIGVDDNDDKSYCKIGTLMGFGANLYKWGLKIPSYDIKASYKDFCNNMGNNEEIFISKGEYGEKDEEKKHED